MSGSDRALCHACPSLELPHRAIYVTVRGIPKFNSGYYGQELCYDFLVSLFKEDLEIVIDWIIFLLRVVLRDLPQLYYSLGKSPL